MRALPSEPGASEASSQGRDAVTALCWLRRGDLPRGPALEAAGAQSRERERRAESKREWEGSAPPRGFESLGSVYWVGREAVSRVTSAPCHVVSPDRGGAREAGGMVGSVSGGSEKSEVPGGPVRVSGSRPHDG